MRRSDDVAVKLVPQHVGMTPLDTSRHRLTKERERLVPVQSADIIGRVVAASRVPAVFRKSRRSMQSPFAQTYFLGHYALCDAGGNAGSRSGIACRKMRTTSRLSRLKLRQDPSDLRSRFSISASFHRRYLANHPGVACGPLPLPAKVREAIGFWGGVRAKLFSVS
jgi:hypothetical protein